MRAEVLNDETVRLYGIVWPILISVSLAPESYFFCADAGEAASSTAPAASARTPRIPALLALHAKYAGNPIMLPPPWCFFVPRGFLIVALVRADIRPRLGSFERDNCTYVRNMKGI